MKSTDELAQELAAKLIRGAQKAGYNWHQAMSSLSRDFKQDDLVANIYWWLEANMKPELAGDPEPKSVSGGLA